MSWARVRALEVLEDMLDAGLQVEADRPHLRVRPAHRLTPELKERAKAVKAELLDALDPPPPEGPCPDCGGISFVRPALGTWTCLSCTELTRPEKARWYFGPLDWAEEAS